MVVTILLKYHVIQNKKSIQFLLVNNNELVRHISTGCILFYFLIKYKL